MQNSMKIVNPGQEDYHMHTFTFSDGANSLDEMVIRAGEVGLEKIGITDHSQHYLETRGTYTLKTSPSILKRWRNIHNNVEVQFGIEADLVNEEGDIATTYYGHSFDLNILSAHATVFKGNPENITKAYLRAIQKHHKKITFLAHPCVYYFAEFLDFDKLIQAANDYGLPMEMDCANLIIGQVHVPHLVKMLDKADQIYVNSDAHMISELGILRDFGFELLRMRGIID